MKSYLLATEFYIFQSELFYLQRLPDMIAAISSLCWDFAMAIANFVQHRLAQ